MTKAPEVFEAVPATKNEVSRTNENGRREGEITSILRLAVEKQVPVETLERLVALQERMSDRAAASEFAQALADFQAECPPIKKTSHASFPGRDSGVKQGYRYAEIDEIARTIQPLLHKRGLSYSWDSKIANGLMEVTCLLDHINGHQKVGHFTTPVESSGGFTQAQKYAGTLTFGRRQSLLSVLGLSTTEQDTDGVARNPGASLTPDQVAHLENVMEEVKADRDRFFKFLCSGRGREISSFADVYESEYAIVLATLEKKRGKA
jgi:hypothetical protein